MLVRMLFLIATLSINASGMAATLVVTSAADTAGSTCASVCTLRQAITAANATAALDTINFAITVPIRGEILIAPATALPTITQPLTINGYSQSGTRVNDHPEASNAILRIRLDGAAVDNSDGLRVCAPNVTIRGLAVTRFEFRGIFVDGSCGASATQVHGNFIGLTVLGAAPAGRQINAGILMSGSGAVGSANVADRNIIGNGRVGINISNTNVSVLGNLFGRNPANNAARPLVVAGIGFLSTGMSGVTVGSLAAPNQIRSSFKGIVLEVGNNNDLAANMVSESSALGIDLGDDGLTLNDVNDVDAGANDLQNFPVIAGVQRVAGGLSINGSLDVGHPGSLAYKLTTYASSVCHPSGHGEGERILGQTTRNISSTAESFSYTQTTTDPLPPGTVITMTATRAGVGTNEFSACAVLDPPPLVVNTNGDTADGVCNAAHCSLRDAIIAANAAAGSSLQRIHFAIPPLTGTSEILIAPTSALPNISRTVTIDGYTQPGAAANTDPLNSNAVIRIRLDGQAAPAAASGLRLCAGGTIVRGLSITRFNTGIEACSTSGSTVAGNFIGLAADGSTAGTGLVGIALNSGPLDVGGSAIADRNIIAAASASISIGTFGSGSRIDNNLLGSDRSASLPRGAGTGVFANASAASIAIGTLAPNAFRFLPQAITLAGNAGSSIEFGNNTFSGHASLAIDLGDNGVTPNDPGDGDSGPNGLQNFPVLILAERTDNGLRVVGDLDSGSNANFAFYASTDCHSSGHGPGEQLLGTTFSTSPSSFDFSLITDVDLTLYDTITATASRDTGTSEMSACITVTDPPPGIAVDRRTDSTTLDGGCDAIGDANTCTLREAITLANAQAGADAIRFAIPGDGPHVITLVSALPEITQGLSIDGYTQVGAAPNADPLESDAVIKIEIRGGSELATLSLCTQELVDVRGLALSGGGVATVTQGSGASCAGPLRIRGTWLGFSASGTGVSGNVGVVARKSLTFGGPALADRNVLGNYATGLLIRDQASGSSVVNNLFGRAPDLSQNAPNTTSIELLDVSGVDVGGELNLVNQIFFGTTAVLIRGASADFNRLYANRFVATTASTAIDLSTASGPDGITPNDLNDVDTGPNDGQNSPVLSDTTATTNSMTVNGVLDVPAGILTPLAYRLAFYRSSTCNDASGSGNGRHGDLFLRSVLQSFSSNSESFTVTFPTQPTVGFITATVTSPDGSTSEFSNCLAAPLPDALFASGFE